MKRLKLACFFSIIVLLLLVLLLYLNNINQKYKNTIIGDHLLEVRENWGVPYFRNVSNGKIYEHFRPNYIDKCVFIYTEKDSLLVEKWWQID